MFAEPDQSLSAPPCDAQGGHAASLAIPRKGHVVSTAANAFGAPLRLAVSLIAKAPTRASAQGIWDRLYARRIGEPGAARSRTPTDLSARMLVAAWATGVATTCLRRDASLLEAESWFLGDSADAGIAATVADTVRLAAERSLHEVSDPRALNDLLPYVLDPHGEGSRMSVMLRPETAAARDSKRSEGVFYTPADVASFMAEATICGLTEDSLPLTVLDPACGSGVFLRAVLSELRRRNPSAEALDLACSCVYGIDIDPWALDAAAFVVLADCIDAVRARRIAPLTAWHAIRLNLAHVDALRLDPGKPVPSGDPARIERLACRAALKAGKLPEAQGHSAPAGAIGLHLLFPELAEGPRVVIGNPPYASVGVGSDLRSLSTRFETLRAAPRPTSDLYPLFVEQMTRLTAPTAHGGAMVLPLSVACNSGRQFAELRRLVARTAGHWRFAFFDREPHALFGEDVKTRNAIVLWTRQGQDSNVQVLTGPLRKWRGEDRARMFSAVDFTPISADIRMGIPKVDGKLQAAAFALLAAEQRTLRHDVAHFGRSTLRDALRDSGSTVFVAATAYNFLSVFLRPHAEALSGDDELTENPMLALACPSQAVAFQVFAILSSKVAYWWWHVHGDGFHVSKYVVETLPVGNALQGAFAVKLGRLGQSLWEEISVKPVVSRNRGKTSLGFSSANSRTREAIDAELVRALGLSPEFQLELQRFCESVTSAQLSSRN